MKLTVAALALLLAGCATVQPRDHVRAEAEVAFDRDGETGAAPRGVADSASGRRVTTDDPVRVAADALPLDASAQGAMADPKSFDRAHGQGDGDCSYSNMNFRSSRA